MEFTHRTFQVCCSLTACPRGRPLSTHTSTRDSWTVTEKFGSDSFGVIGPFSWVLVHTRFCLCPPRGCFPSPVDVLYSNPTGLQSQIPWGSSVPLPDPYIGKSVVGPRTFTTVTKITAAGDCSHEVKRHLLLGRKAMTNLDSILKIRDITLPTKVRLVKAMVLPVVMYGCESWTIKKAECRRIDVFKLWCWRRLLRVPWTARRSNQSILKEISPEYSLKGLMLKLKLQC